jgi:hypothetical protein
MTYEELEEWLDTIKYRREHAKEQLRYWQDRLTEEEAMYAEVEYRLLASDPMRGTADYMARQLAEGIDKEIMESLKK